MASDYGRKVARAARTGGGVTARGQRPWGWYFVLILICAIGIPLIAISRQEHIRNAHPDAGDHWHTAFGFDVCGSFQPVLKDDFQVASVNAQGNKNAVLPAIHTHNDGVVHIEPNVLNPSSSSYGTDLQSVSGKKATFGKFVTSYNQLIPGLSVTSTSFKLPTDSAPHKNGDKCKGKPAVVQVAVWSNIKQKNPSHVSDANSIKLKNGGVITVALLPKGSKIPQPPSIAALKSLLGTKKVQHQTGSSSTTSSTKK
jgi:hypothetical protein